MAEQSAQHQEPAGPVDDGSEARPFASADEHLHAELERVDLLWRLAALRWRHGQAEDKPAELWGLTHVSDAEFERILAAPFALDPPTAPDEDPEQALLLAQLAQQDEELGRRLAASPQALSWPLAWTITLTGLSSLERDALLLVVLCALSPRHRRLSAYLQDDARRAAPSVDVLLTALAGTGATLAERRACLAPDGRLRRHDLVTVTGSGDSPDHLRSVHVDESLLLHLLGRPCVPATLAGRVQLRPADHSAPGPERDPALERRLDGAASLWQANAPVGACSVELLGPPGSGRRSAASRLAARLDCDLLETSLERLISEPGDPLETARHCSRLAWLQRRVLVCVLGPAPAVDPTAQAVAAILERHPGPLLWLTPEALPSCLRGAQRPHLSLRLHDADTGLREAAWSQHLSAEPMLAGQPITELSARLARSFRLPLDELAALVADARLLAWARAPDSPRIEAEDLLQLARSRSTRAFDGLARRVRSDGRTGLEDLVLPPASRRQLDDLRVRMANRLRVREHLSRSGRLPGGLGLCALFSGASGTGKSFAARLLASEQGIDLYRIDLSSVVSKYVGETERNLERVFEQAERANALLFFDEADALFGKRGSVKDARDRWANLEVNYLLQRVEDFDGVVILATNLRQNIDEAFLRRLHTIVEFPEPDEEGRLRLWQQLLPADTERPDDATIGRLARRFALPGGSIRNVVVEALHRAVAVAGDESPRLTEAHLAGALARELHKLGRPVTRGDFGDALYPHAEAEFAG